MKRKPPRIGELLDAAESNLAILNEALSPTEPLAVRTGIRDTLCHVRSARGHLNTELKRQQSSLRSALSLLDRMDDDITEMGGDDDEYGRADLARIRRLKAHLHKAQRLSEAFTE